MKRLILAVTLAALSTATAFAQTKETMPMKDGMAAPAMKDAMAPAGAPMKDGMAAPAMTDAMPKKP
jgi:hypothetical protein